MKIYITILRTMSVETDRQKSIRRFSKAVSKSLNIESVGLDNFPIIYPRRDRAAGDGDSFQNTNQISRSLEPKTQWLFLLHFPVHLQISVWKHLRSSIFSGFQAPKGKEEEKGPRWKFEFKRKPYSPTQVLSSFRLLLLLLWDQSLS